jgi:hypothetical protein
MCAEPQASRVQPWIQTKGALLRAHVADEPRNPQRFRAHRRGRTSAPSGVTARRRIRGISQMKGRLRSSANHGSRRRQSRDPARTPLARSHSSSRRKKKPPTTYPSATRRHPSGNGTGSRPSMGQYSQNDRDDLRDSRLGDYISGAISRRVPEKVPRARCNRGSVGHPIHRECP